MEEKIKNVKEKIKSELTAELYEEVSNTFNYIFNIYKQTDKFCKEEEKRKDHYIEMYNKEVEEKVKAESNEQRWRKYYQEVLRKQAQLEIDLDVANEKIKLLGKPEQN